MDIQSFERYQKRFAEKKFARWRFVKSVSILSNSADFSMVKFLERPISLKILNLKYFHCFHKQLKNYVARFARVNHKIYFCVQPKSLE